MTWFVTPGVVNSYSKVSSNSAALLLVISRSFSYRVTTLNFYNR
jgi:hypothetical protein